MVIILEYHLITEVNQARVFGAAGRRGADGPGGPRRGDSLDKGDIYRERSPLDDRGRDRGDRYSAVCPCVTAKQRLAVL